jgi:HD-like signal output (HDOD) protein
LIRSGFLEQRLNPEIEAQLRLSVNFPSPPGVATHIIELAQDPEIEMGKVAKALSMDSALSSKVLRIANSPLYAQRRKSENLRQALVVLGLNATLTLALSFSLVKSLRGAKSNGLDYKYYWRRALLSATAARALSDFMHQTLAEEVFLAALLQDVGMLALDVSVPDMYRGVGPLQHDHAALAELETQRLQVDHAYVGAGLCATGISPSVCTPPSATATNCSNPIPRSRRRFSNAAWRCQGRSRICFYSNPTSGNSPRPRCAPSAAWGWTRWRSARCSAP